MKLSAPLLTLALSASSFLGVDARMHRQHSHRDLAQRYKGVFLASVHERRSDLVLVQETIPPTLLACAEACMPARPLVGETLLNNQQTWQQVPTPKIKVAP